MVGVFGDFLRKQRTLHSFDLCCEFRQENIFAMDPQYIASILGYLLKVFLLTSLMPFILLYLSIAILNVYAVYWKVNGSTKKLPIRWNAAFTLISHIWIAHARLWHGYEVHGLEHVPTDKPALLVVYHGSLPMDAYYLISKIYLHHNRLLHSVGAKFLFRLPGFPTLLRAYGVLTGTLSTCSALLQRNNLLLIMPGGIFEAQFSSSANYDILWKQRLGFAKVAIDAKCMIIPVFTENIKEAYKNALFGSVGKRICMKLYSWTKLPFSMVYGGFPVKLVTYIGEPIPFDPALTAEELKTKVVSAVEDLIREHQELPGSVVHALLDRIPEYRAKRKEHYIPNKLLR